VHSTAVSWASRIAAVALIALACVQSPIGDPAGDNNYDDPDDPGQTGDNSVYPEGGDAYGQSCVAARDCPADWLCAFPIANGCAATGRCLPLTATAGCDAMAACACSGTTIDLCAPSGYASKQVSTLGACVEDAGGDAADAGGDAGADDSGDAASSS
jgi:hypothetical protein